MKGYRDEELSTRWIQFGVFSPIMRLHSSNSAFTGKEPWNYNAVSENIMKRYLKLRHEMIPYLYTMNYHPLMTTAIDTSNVLPGIRAAGSI